MAATAPRWEWRTWGTTFGAVDRALCQLTTASRKIRETYIVSSASPAAVRIRHATLDVRLPLDADALGTRLWSAPHQAMFPLDVEAVSRLFAVWDLRMPRLRRERYDIEAFVRDIVVPTEELAPVNVVEDRHMVYVEGCAVEIGDVTFDGRPLRTLAVSMADRERVIEIVRVLRLSVSRSVDYVQALQRHLAVQRCGWPYIESGAA